MTSLSLLPGLATAPVVYIFGGTILLVAVTLTDLAFELVTLAVGHVQIVVGEFP